MQAWAAKLDEEDLRFCAAVSAGALWPDAGPFSPAPSDVQGEGKEGKHKRHKVVVGRKFDAKYVLQNQSP